MSNLSDIKNIITYNSTDEPLEPRIGDIWLRKNGTTQTKHKTVYQSIPTNAGFRFKEFTIGSNYYLGIGNYYDGSTHKLNSKIYKWDTSTSTFDLYQNIATSGCVDINHFTIGTDHYLGVANYNNDTTHKFNSKIYKWNVSTSKFDFFQNIATSGAHDIEHFEIGTDHYLGVVNFYDGSTHKLNSKIYKWNAGTSTFNFFQNIATSGAHNIEYFTIGSNNYLGISNSYNDSTYKVNSKIYKWNSGTSKFDFFQNIATSGAHDIEHFEIGSDYYLGVANAYNDSTRNINSKIYKWNSGTSTFDFYQDIATHYSRVFKHFEIDSDHYLGVANAYNDKTYNINSKIYKWDTSTSKFIEHQFIDTNGCIDIEYFTIDSNNYISVANYYNGSTYNIDSNIYEWYPSLELFGGSSIIDNQEVFEDKFTFDGERWKIARFDAYNKGYIVGGYDGSNRLSTIERITFPFDGGVTSSIKNLVTQLSSHTGCNSSTNGYICGGYDGSNYISTINRIDFPFDNGTISHILNLSSSKNHLSSCNSSHNGYIIAGINVSNNFSTIDRIIFTFNSETISHVGNLNSSKSYISSCNSSQHGYTFTGYVSSTYYSTIERISFPFNIGTASHVGDLNSSKYAACSFNSSLHGYMCGGYRPSSFSTVERIAFPFDSGTASIINSLSYEKHATNSINSSVHGYIIGGNNSGTGLGLSTIERLTFSFDSGYSMSVGSLDNKNYYGCGVDSTDFNILFV